MYFLFFPIILFQVLQIYMYISDSAFNQFVGFSSVIFPNIWVFSIELPLIYRIDFSLCNNRRMQQKLVFHSQRFRAKAPQAFSQKFNTPTLKQSDKIAHIFQQYHLAALFIYADTKSSLAE